MKNEYREQTYNKFLKVSSLIKEGKIEEAKTLLQSSNYEIEISDILKAREEEKIKDSLEILQGIPDKLKNNDDDSLLEIEDMFEMAFILLGGK